MKELNLNLFARIFAVVMFFEIYLTNNLLAQCQPLGAPAPTYNCEDVVVGVPPGKSGFFMNTPSNLEVVFDSYSDYAGSVVLSGATQLAITAEQLAASLPSQCKWELQMVVDNSTFGAPVAPIVAPAPDEWFPDVIYGLGSSGPYPQIYELEVRINNACGTPISTVYQNFTNDFDAITIIDGTVLQAAGSCASGVNGAGSFLTNYSEYTFNIDYKIKLDASTLFGGLPNPFAYNPGRYKLNVHFCLREIP
jgi:hypothetical protein